MGHPAVVSWPRVQGSFDCAALRFACPRSAQDDNIRELIFEGLAPVDSDLSTADEIDGLRIAHYRYRSIRIGDGGGASDVVDYVQNSSRA